jgi:Glycosyl transferase family 2
MDVSFVIPCLNEEDSLPSVLREIITCPDLQIFEYEVIVADNGSTDRSAKIAHEHNAKVINVIERGYGAALKGGIRAASGDVVVMADADGSYKFCESRKLIQQVLDGADLAMGNRFRGGIEPGAMPWLHRFLGNPILSFLGRKMFGVSVRDFHCGLRAFRRESVIRLDLLSNGMEFASEMIIEASRHGLQIVEHPVTLSRDLRNRPPHLRTWADGIRHLKLLFKYNPKYLFGPPSAVLVVIALSLLALGLKGPTDLASRELSIRATSTALVVSLVLINVLYCLDFVRRIMDKKLGLSPIVKYRKHAVVASLLVGILSLVWILVEVSSWLSGDLSINPDLQQIMQFILCLFGLGASLMTLTFVAMYSIFQFHRD